MQGVLLVIICCVMTDDFLVRSLSLPGVVHFLPEALSACVTLYVAIAGTRDRFRLVAPKYWLVFGAFALVILCGILNNAPGAGPMLTGARFHLRAFPLFLLAAVAPPSERQFKRLLNLVLALAAIQLPLTVKQRWVVQSEGRHTGDEVWGTIMDSGILSIFLICVALVLTGLRVRKRIPTFAYAVLAFLLLIPTTINETKGTLILLPIALLTVVLVGSPSGKRTRMFVLSVTLFAIFLAGFIPAAVVALCLCVLVLIQTHVLGWPKDTATSWQRLLRASKEALVPMVIPVVILGGFYLGAFTATEAGAIVAFYSLMAAKLYYRNISWVQVLHIAYESGVLTGVPSLRKLSRLKYCWLAN